MTDEVKKITENSQTEVGETSVTARPGDATPEVSIDIMARGSMPAPEENPAGGRGGRGGHGGRGGGGRGGRDGRGGGRDREDKEFNQVTLDLARVTRVTKGGKRMRFRATVIVGDGKGRVGFATCKGVDVQASVGKAANKAKKNLIKIPLVHGTIPHMVQCKSGAALVRIMPAPEGSGIIAGGPVRMALQIAGVPNASAKILGSSNKINNVRAAVEALKMLKPVRVHKEKAE